MRFFNTAGPIKPQDHYYVPHRLNEAEMRQLITEKKYFILHAPRQSGKTTAINLFADALNKEGNYYALYINVEAAQAARGNVEKGLFTILDVIKTETQRAFTDSSALDFFTSFTAAEVSGNSLQACLDFFSSHLDKPFILFIDEIDSLVGDTLISVLRQLRTGYIKRPEHFPQSICLIGVRDVRDYRIWSETEHSMILGGSAFNIKAESLVLHNFSPEQVRYLYEQHTQETGQHFTDEAIEYAFYLTQGQPWLVNALAYQACFKDITDRTQPITKEVIERAKETLILRRDTHLDVLTDRLHEPRVRAIIDAIISGQDIPENFPIDDISYVIDLGLIAKQGKHLIIANPIYQEIIPRELSRATQMTIIQESLWYQNEDGSLNMLKLLEAFTQFYRQNSDIWLGKFDYKEAGPHLLLMAFLQRIINGGGKIHRKYALGRRRVDLLIEWPYFAKASDFVKTSSDMSSDKLNQRIVIELKIRRGENTLNEGLMQTSNYMDINNATEGHLLIFDRNINKAWDEKIFTQEHIFGKDKITVWGL